MTLRNGLGGLTIVGYLGAPSGVGQSARNTINSLRDKNISINTINIPTPIDQPDLLQIFGGINSFDPGEASRVVCFVNADVWLPHIIESQILPNNIETLCGVWAWEIEHFPGYFSSTADHVDQIFAVSNWSARLLNSHLGKNVTSLISLNFLQLLSNLENSFLPRMTKDFIKFVNQCNLEILPNKYLYFSFDCHSVVNRKNPYAIFNIWRRVAGYFPEYSLLVKYSNADHEFDTQLKSFAKSLPRVYLLSGIISYENQQMLIRNSQLVLTLHRAEGLGLLPIEAASHDVPVVYTNYGGFCEILPSGHFPVEWEYTEVGLDSVPYPSNAFWAEPNINHAVSQVLLALELKKSGEWLKNSRNRIKEFGETLIQLREESIHKLIN